MDRSSQAPGRTDILNRPLYTVAEASRLAGLTPHRAARWLRGYRYSYAVSTPERSRTGRKGPIVSRRGKADPYASFLELVDLLAVKELLTAGFTLQKLRKLLAEVEGISGQPHFAHESFFRMGSALFLKTRELGGAIILLLSGGQSAIPGIIEAVAERIEFDPVTKTAIRWYPRGPDYPVVVDPAISFGRPSVVRRGIATSVLYDLFLGERKDLRSTSRWMDISPEETKAAIEFERHLHKQAV